MGSFLYIIERKMKKIFKHLVDIIKQMAEIVICVIFGVLKIMGLHKLSCRFLTWRQKRQKKTCQCSNYILKWYLTGFTENLRKLHICKIEENEQ